MAHGGGRLTAHIRRSRRINQLAFVAFAVAAILPVILINPPVKEQQEASATTGTATAATTEITLTTEESRASVDIESLDPIGSFAISEDEETATFTLTTNNYTGYTLSIKTDDGAGTLSAETEGDTLASIEASTQYSAFSAKTAEAAENYNGKWGIKPSKYMNGDDIITNDSEDPVFLPSPTTTPTKLDKTTAANAPNTANEYTLALGVRADYTVHSGSYTRVFQLVALANPVAYSITFNKNTTDTVSNMPANQSSDAITETTITLPSTVPTRAHYSFLGWCNTTPTTNNGTDSCSGTVYNPNGAGTNLTYGIDQTIANTTTLYAMWKLEKFTINLTISGGANEIIIDGVGYSGSSVSLAYGTYTISGSYNSGYEFGSWATSGSVSVASTSSASTTMTVSGAGTLTLNGKNKLFFQNATSAQCGQTMYDNRGTDAYKNIAYTTASINGLCWMTRNLDLPGGTTLTAADSNVISNYTLPASSTSGFNNASTAYVYNSNRTTCGINSPCYSYYSYAAATAGTNPSSGNATSDICPKGWRLPTKAEYTALYGTYTTGATLTASPFYGVYAGYYLYSSSSFGGSVGYYWSSTAYNASGAYSLYFYSSSAYVVNDYKYGGYSVRCVLNPPASDISQISTMQDFATSNVSAVKDSMALGQAYTLTDSRDGTSYAVGKLADGNVWMLDNLALGAVTLTEAISSSNTNIPSGVSFTLPASISSGFNSYTAAQINTASYTSTYSYGSGSGKVGVYYNYCAATAGGICMENNYSNASADRDICPKGWRLPTGGSSGEYQALYTAYSSNVTNFKNALRTPLSGGFYNSSAYSQGSYGSFWSATRLNDYYIYNLYVYSSYVYPQLSDDRNYGFPVRCVLK